MSFRNSCQRADHDGSGHVWMDDSMYKRTRVCVCVCAHSRLCLCVGGSEYLCEGVSCVFICWLECLMEGRVYIYYKLRESVCVCVCV